MKTHQGKVANYLDGDKIYSSQLNGSFDTGFTSMSIYSLNPKVEGKDLVFDVMLKELVNHKQHLENDKEIVIHVEWDITDDYREYIACRVLKAEVMELSQ